MREERGYTPRPESRQAETMPLPVNPFAATRLSEAEAAKAAREPAAAPRSSARARRAPVQLGPAAATEAEVSAALRGMVPEKKKAPRRKK